MTDPDVLVTVKEYAALFRRNPSSIYTAIRKGRLPYPIVRPTGTDYFLIRLPRDLAHTERHRETENSTHA